MSISSPQAAISPVTKYYKWSGSKGLFEYYNKETKENVESKSLNIIILDQFATVSGFHSETSTGIYSNEIKGVEELTVKTYKGEEIAKGKWKDIKEVVKNQGGKYAKSLYCGLIIANKIVEIINLKLYGSGVGAIIEAKPKDGDCYLFESSKEMLKKGATKYYSPKITKQETDMALYEEAKKMDIEILQKYFKESKKAKESTTVLEDNIDDFNYEEAVGEINLGDFED
jgi:hypothetical protein